MALKPVDRLRTKLWGGVRFGMVHCFPRVLGLVTVNEFPKSGGTWLGQMLSRALELPFPRNRRPVFGESIMHGHYLRPGGMRNVVVLFRDGRDVMVSWYHHCLFDHGLGNAFLVRRVRDELDLADPRDVELGLPRFIEYAFTRQRHPPFSWSDFVRSWCDQTRGPSIRYEDLRSDPAGELVRLVSELGYPPLSRDRAEGVADACSFERLTGRSAGEEDKGSFLRKGIVGDWRNHFSPEAREVFHHYAGQELRLLGYEDDDQWVEDCE